MKFRKKPVVIEATQWLKNGDHPLDYSETRHDYEKGILRPFSPEERKANGWEGDIVRYFRHPDKAYAGERSCVHCGVIMHKHGWIDTLEGGHVVCPGDWIITGVKGEHYPCKPDIFALTYDPEELPDDKLDGKWCWSTDGEEFQGQLETEEQAHVEAQQELWDQCDSGDKTSYWIGRIKSPFKLLEKTTKWLGESLLEDVNERLWDEVGGEEDPFELTKEQREELGRTVVDFFKQNASAQRWGVTDSKEHDWTVTENQP